MSADVKAWPNGKGQWAFVTDEPDCPSYGYVVNTLDDVLARYPELTTWTIKMDSKAQAYLDGRP